MTDYTRFKYSGATPGGDSNDYILFSTVTAFPGKCAHQMAGLHKLVLDLFHTQAGTLKLYRSSDRGTTWTQVTSEAKAIPSAGTSSQYEVLVECFEDFKLVWTNGGVAQATWYVDCALTDERGLSAAAVGGPAPEVPETIANLHSWFRADAEDLTIATGVSAWASKVNGYVLSQAVGANQPVFTTAAVLGGRGVLAFDGTNDRLASTAAASTWKFIHDGTGCTIFIACVMRRNAAAYSAIMGTSTASAALIGFSFGNSGPATNLMHHYVANGGATRPLAANLNPGGSILDAKTLFDFSYKEGSSPENLTRRNAGTLASGNSAAAPSASDPSNTLSLGTDGAGTSFGLMDVAEIIIYNAELSAGDRTAVYNYLDARYT